MLMAELARSMSTQPPTGPSPLSCMPSKSAMMRDGTAEHAFTLSDRRVCGLRSISHRLTCSVRSWSSAGEGGVREQVGCPGVARVRDRLQSRGVEDVRDRLFGHYVHDLRRLTCGNDDYGRPGSSCRPGPGCSIRTARETQCWRMLRRSRAATSRKTAGIPAVSRCDMQGPARRWGRDIGQAVIASQRACSPGFPRRAPQPRRARPDSRRHGVSSRKRPGRIRLNRHPCTRRIGRPCCN